MLRGLALVGLLHGAAVAQPAPDSSVVVVPGPQFRAGGLHRLFLGSTHRDLWTTPIRVPVLDLARHGGGLVATERGGSKQSRSLRFKAGDGRVYVFRALEKDPTQTWPPALRSSPARRFAEDQISAIFPAGAVAVAGLERAAGLVNPGVALVTLPDDPRLGEWREEFARTAGVLEQRLRGSGDAIQDVPGASEVVVSEALFRRLGEHPSHRVDEPAYLAARLFDLVVGDWDRHEGQWYWAGFPTGDATRWVPIPRDRDWALSRLDGPLYGLLRLYLPKYQSFGPEFGSIYGLTVSAEPLDRRLLTGLERPVWDSVVTDLMGRLSDSAIAAAVGGLPSEFDSTATSQLVQALRNRRDRLPEAAGRFYRQLAGTVEWWGTDGPDRVDLTATTDGAVEAVLHTGRFVRARRRFLVGETDELRLYLRGGADSVRWTGPAATHIKIRVVDPERPDLSEAAPVLVADRTRPTAPPSAAAMPRDWGTLYGVAPWFESRPEIGTLVGGGPVFYRYGFRKAPYAARLAFRVGYATGAPGFNADFSGDFRFQQPDRRFLVRAGLLRIDAVRFFGFGNEGPLDREREYYEVRQQLYFVEPTFERSLGGRATVSLGGMVRTSRTDLDDESLLTDTKPYGAGNFTEAGLRAGVRVDTRDHPVFPTRGVRADLTTTLVPGLFDVARTFGGVQATGASYLGFRGLPARPTLALRAGAARQWGPVPFFEAASIGGRSSVRGLNSRRFLGHASLFGSAEVRLELGSFTAIVPGEWGIYGLGDVGRVYAKASPSDTWHSAAGAGLWFALLDRKSTMTVTWAAAEERSRLYLQAGFHF